MIVRSKVRIRVERMPTCSTVPSMSSTLIQSPTSNGLSLTMAMEPITFSSVFCAPSAIAIPPMPRPASSVPTGMLNCDSTAAKPRKPTSTFASRPPSGASDSTSARWAAHAEAMTRFSMTPRARISAQKSAAVTAALTRLRDDSLDHAR